MASHGSCFMVTWIMLKNHLLEIGLINTKSGDHGTRNAHNRWFILFHHVRGLVWIEIHWSSIWLRAWSHMASHYTWGPVTTLNDFRSVLGQPLDTHFLLGSHNFMVMALGSCVKWPLVSANCIKVETPYHDNDLILTPILSPQSGWQWTWSARNFTWAVLGMADGNCWHLGGATRWKSQILIHIWTFLAIISVASEVFLCSFGISLWLTK
jgi:hypothetical protein